MTKTQGALRALATAVAISAAAFGTTAAAQSAPGGTCQIFEHANYQGAAGTVVGSVGVGDVVMFVDEANAPADLRGFLENRVGYRVFFDPSWAKMLSSVKVSNGCTAELHNRLEMFQGSVYPFKKYTSDTSYIGNEENDQAMMAICRCPQ